MNVYVLWGGFGCGSDGLGICWNVLMIRMKDIGTIFDDFSGFSIINFMKAKSKK